MSGWADELAVKSPYYMEVDTYDFIMGKKRQALTIGLGPHRWELTHIEAVIGKNALPVSWKRKYHFNDAFLVINR